MNARLDYARTTASTSSRRARGSSGSPTASDVRLAPYPSGLRHVDQAFDYPCRGVADVLETSGANGRPAALVSSGGKTAALLTVDASAEGIDRVLWVLSPAKLAPFVAALDG